MNAAFLVLALACVFVLAYRPYGAFLAETVLRLDNLFARHARRSAIISRPSLPPSRLWIALLTLVMNIQTFLGTKFIAQIV